MSLLDSWLVSFWMVATRHPRWRVTVVSALSAIIVAVAFSVLAGPRTTQPAVSAGLSPWPPASTMDATPGPQERSGQVLPAPREPGAAADSD